MKLHRPVNLSDPAFFRLFAARQRLLENVAEPLRVDELARESGWSTFYFLRLFRKTFGETPHRLGMAFRLARAKELLAETDMPITEICFECGYESLGTFSHLFRRATGCSPREHRLQRRRFWSMDLSLLPVVLPFCLYDGFRGRPMEGNFREVI